MRTLDPVNLALPAGPERLEELRELVRAVESDRTTEEQIEIAIPAGGPRLVSGIIHEWFGHADEAAGLAREDWQPPLCLFTKIGALALERSPHTYAVWIGRRCRPSAGVLVGAGGARALLRRSVFVDAPDASSRLWATDLALRCPAVAVVIADGTACTMAASRRLQLAAQGRPALALIARPPRERQSLSAAGARWRVAAEPSPSRRPRWAVELLRCKGVQPEHGAPRRWAVEWDHAKGLVAVPAGLAAGPAGAEVAAIGPRFARSA